MNCVPTSFFPKFRRRLCAPCVVGVCCFASAFLTFVMRTPAQQEKSPLKVVDNGHTITVSYAPGSFITVGDHKYQLLQFHFHRPSEELINGKHYDMVAHLVHADADRKLAVVAVLLKTGSANAVLQTVWDHLPAERGKRTRRKESPRTPQTWCR